LFQPRICFKQEVIRFDISLTGSYPNNFDFEMDLYRSRIVKSLLYLVVGISQQYAVASFIDRA